MTTKSNSSSKAQPIRHANRGLRVAADMARTQLTWAAWFLCFVTLVYVIIEVNAQNFITLAFQPSKMFMLVIGIVSVSGFLNFYARLGVTRTAYFYGSSLAAATVALVLMGGVGVLGSLQHWLIPAPEKVSILGENDSWLLTVLVYMLNALVYYLAGYVIGIGFYRFGKFGGMLYIVLALGILATSEALWDRELKDLINRVVYIGELPLGVSLLGSLLLIGVALGIIGATMKRVRIKIK
ncbi:hypothetical protein [Paenibacillus phocaensis]|uniref:hypothetical protein n=1 Tax=Paenibacillus phocaensis TaxID=1776378 RepID=UPI000839D382|nr:hypothetical protein [Paenibacillus phocaensis]